MDAGEEEPALRLHSKIIAENGYWTDVSSAQVGFVPVGKDAPEKLCFKRLDYLNDYRYCIELLGTVYLGDGSSDTTAVNYFNKRAALTWDCETYEMSNGCTALLPLCTSNPNSSPWSSCRAYFEKDGILYQLACTPVSNYFDGSVVTLDDCRATLRQVLDGFE